MNDNKNEFVSLSYVVGKASGSPLGAGDNRAVRAGEKLYRLEELHLINNVEDWYVRVGNDERWKIPKNESVVIIKLYKAFIDFRIDSIKNRKIENCLEKCVNEDCEDLIGFIIEIGKIYDEHKDFIETSDRFNESVFKRYKFTQRAYAIIDKISDDIYTISSIGDEDLAYLYFEEYYKKIKGVSQISFETIMKNLLEFEK